MKLRAISLSLIIALAVGSPLFSQTRRSAGSRGYKVQTFEKGHSFHAGLGLGASGLSYPLQYGKVSPSWGLTADFKYTYFFRSWFGISAGMSFTTFESKAQLTQQISYFNQVDTEGDPYVHRVDFDNWKEKQQCFMFSIPLELNFRYKQPRKMLGYYGNIGVQAAFPIYSRYETTGRTIHSGYYPQWDLLLQDLSGRYGSDDLFSTSGDLDFLKVNLYTTIELGVSFQVKPKMDILLGLYAGYCVHDITGRRYQNRRDIGFASGFSNVGSFMEKYQGIIGTNIAGDIHPWQVGIKVGLQCSLEKYSEQDKERARKRAAKEAKKLAELGKHDTIYIERAALHDTVYIFDTVYVSTLQKIYSREERERMVQLEDMLRRSVIWFRFDEYEPILEPSYILDSIATVLVAHPLLRVHVNGHACSIGTDGYNQRLALSRAEAVADLLKAKGVHEHQLIVESFGASHPFHYQGTHQKARDRRVEIIPVGLEADGESSVSEPVVVETHRTSMQIDFMRYEQFLGEVTIKEGDVLARIAEEWYGDADYWVFIYEANADKLRSPNALKVGSVIMIPDPNPILEFLTEDEQGIYILQLQEKYNAL